MLGELLAVDGGEGVGLGMVPEPIEPRLDPGHDAGLILAEVELEVRREAGEGEVRRAGKNPLLAREEEGLPVEEAVLVAAHLDLPGVQKPDELAHRTAAPCGEREAVTVPPELPLCLLKLLGGQLPLIALAPGLPQAALPEPRRRKRLGTQEEAHPGGAPEHIGQPAEAPGVEVPRGDGDFGRLLEGPQEVREPLPERPLQGVPVQVCRRTPDGSSRASPRSVVVQSGPQGFLVLPPLVEGLEDVD